MDPANAGATARTPEGLILLSREECGLCEDMQADLAALALQHPLPALTVRDVDSDPAWQRRFGLKVPVLLLDGSPVCHGRLDRAELLRALGLRIRL